MAAAVTIASVAVPFAIVRAKFSWELYCQYWVHGFAVAHMVLSMVFNDDNEYSLPGWSYDNVIWKDEMVHVCKNTSASI